MSEKIKERQLEILEDTVKYYSEDVLRRCVDNDECRYSPESLNIQDISEGCAIGRLLPREICNKLDDLDPNLSARSLFDTERYPNLGIPQDILDLRKGFLTDLQALHDLNHHWDENGLSEKGKKLVSIIKQRIETDYYN